MNGFPGFWRFAWLFFMQPISLHRLLKGWRIEDPDEPGFQFWRRRLDLSEAERWWIGASGRLLLLLTPVLSFGLAGLFELAGFPVNYRGVAMGVAMGVAFGVAWGVARVAWGVAMGVAFGVAWGVAWGVDAGVTVGVNRGVAFGVALGVVAGVFGGVAKGVAVRLNRGVAFGVAMGVAMGVAEGVAVGVAVGVAGAVACIAVILRVPVFVAELAPAVAASLAGRVNWCPVLFHDLSYFPHPLLLQTIVDNAAGNPAMARRVLDACAIAPGQRRIGQRAEAELQARDLSRLIRTGQLTDLIELNAAWLPGKQGASPLLLAFGEAAQYLSAAREALNPHHRVGHLSKLSDSLRAIENQMRSESSPFQEALLLLQEIAQTELRQAKTDAERTLFNPFRAGEPLSPEEGPELFVGRESAIREIEELLVDPSHSASVLLLAPRRCGKSSLLKMLPAKLPDAVCVFFDLQAHPVSSSASFFEKLAEQAVLAGKLDRRIAIPPLPKGPPIEAAAKWLDQLEAIAGSRRILLAIDEFERLEDLFPGSRQEFLQLMGLLRATIQHKRKVRLLVSGAAPFDELSSVWDDHFINTQQVRLNFLNAPTTEGLLCRPTPEFPTDLISAEVAARIYQRTGGQPYLVQMYGSKLVGRLAQAPGGRRPAAVDDVDAIEPRVLEAADSFLRHSFTSAPEDVKPWLEKLASGEANGNEASPKVRQWLNRRNLLTPAGELSVPALGTWIIKNAEYARA